MGWASGSYLCEEIWKTMKEYIPEDKWDKASADLCGHFVANDADDFECYPGTPYWNYIKFNDEDEFLTSLKEGYDDGYYSLEVIKKELKGFHYSGYNVILKKWIYEDILGKEPITAYDAVDFDTVEEDKEDDFLDELLAEQQAERDEEMLWSGEWYWEG